MKTPISKRSSIRDLLLTEGVGEVPIDKPLNHYLKKPVGTKVITTSDKIQSEDEVVKECKAYLSVRGWICKTIYTGGIPAGNRYLPNPAKGIPDCIAFHPRNKDVIWIEFKKSKGGIISAEQRAWHILLENSRQKVFVINSLAALKEALNEPK